MTEIRIKTQECEYLIPEGKPVMISWKAKNKSRPGINVGIGWVKRGEKPHTLELVHQTFSTWDKIENEYSCKWTIWMSQITDIRILSSTRGVKR